MKIGYIVRKGSGDSQKEIFDFREASFTRTINSRGDRIKSKILLNAVDYDEIVSNAEIMRNNNIIIVNEPFLLDDELREKALKWIHWANEVDRKEYDPFY